MAPTTGWWREVDVQPTTINYAKTNNGLSIAYQVLGSEPFNLVYTPGWVSNIDAAWNLPVDPSAHPRVRHDQPGDPFQPAEQRPVRSSYGVELASARVRVENIKAVMNAAASERAVLLGFENGGMLTAMFAASPDTELPVHRGAKPDYLGDRGHERAMLGWDAPAPEPSYRNQRLRQRTSRRAAPRHRIIDQRAVLNVASTSCSRGEPKERICRDQLARRGRNPVRIRLSPPIAPSSRVSTLARLFTNIVVTRRRDAGVRGSPCRSPVRYRRSHRATASCSSTAELAPERRRSHLETFPRGGLGE